MTGATVPGSVQAAAGAAAASPAALRPIGFEAIAGWADDDHGAAFAAFRRSAAVLGPSPPKTRALGVDGAALQAVAARALAEPAALGGAPARRFFETWFEPARIEAPGFVTGYYEPELPASRLPTAAFRVPLYRRPPDLADVRAGDAPPGWDPAMRFGRRDGGRLRPYHDRAAIEEGALAGRGLELAWLADPVDVYFVHVQGSARLRLEDGTVLRVAYDGKSGHPYTSIGRLAVERGLLPAAAADKTALEVRLKADPAAGRALMRENRSFIFFREVAGLAREDGPMGAAGVPLTCGRSLAVDRTAMTFHAPLWVAVPDLADPDDATRPYRRLMIAQDTGSAIVGPARGDLFLGTGDEAGARAGRIRHAAQMTVLVPRPEPRAP